MAEPPATIGAAVWRGGAAGCSSLARVAANGSPTGRRSALSVAGDPRRPWCARPVAPVPPPVRPSPPALPGVYHRGDAIGDRTASTGSSGKAASASSTWSPRGAGGGASALKTIRDDLAPRRRHAARSSARKRSSGSASAATPTWCAPTSWTRSTGGSSWRWSTCAPTPGACRASRTPRARPARPRPGAALGHPVLPRHGVRLLARHPLPSRHQAREHPARRRRRGAHHGLRHRRGGGAGGRGAAARAAPSRAWAEPWPGSVFGTPTHMSPEQFEDAASCDERSDVYSFGVVLYQMASRRALCPSVRGSRPDPTRPRRFFLAMRRLHEEESAAASRLAAHAPDHALPQKDRAAPLSRLRGPARRPRAHACASAPARASWFPRRGRPRKSCARRASASRAWAATGRLSPATTRPRTEPRRRVLHNNRGNALSHLGRLDEALVAFARAVELRPATTGPSPTGASPSRGPAAFAKALVRRRPGARLNARSSETWQGRGVALAGLGRRDEAIAAYEAALAIDARDPLAWGNKAGQPAGARPILGGDLALRPGSVPRSRDAASAGTGKATALAQMGRHRRPCPATTRPSASSPGTHAPTTTRATRSCSSSATRKPLRASGRRTCSPRRPRASGTTARSRELVLAQPQRAGVSLRRYLSLAPPRDGLFAEPSGSCTASTPGELTQTRDEALAAQARASCAPRSRGSVHPRPERAPRPDPPPCRRHGEPASPAVGRAPAAAPRRPPLGPTVADLNDEGDRHFRAGRFAEALACFERALELDPFDATALGNRANALFKLGRVEEAIAGHERALACDPFFLASWASKAAIEQMSGRKAGPSPRIREVVARLAGKAQRSAEAQAQVTQLEQAGVTPRPARPLSWLGAGARHGARRPSHRRPSMLSTGPSPRPTSPRPG